MNVQRTLVRATACLALALFSAACGIDPGGSSGEDSSELIPLDKALAESVPSEFRGGSKPISVGVSYPNPPMVVPDPANPQEFDGFDIDYFRQLSSILDLEFEFHPVKFDALIPGLQSGRFDIALAGIYDTREREEIVDIVTFGSDGFSLIARKGNPEGITRDGLCGRTVSATSGGIAATEYLPQIAAKCAERELPDIETRVAPGVDENLLALDTGRTDAYAATAITGTVLIQEAGEKYELVGEPEISYEIGVGLQKNSELSEPIRAATQKFMNTDLYADLLSKWGLSAFAIERSRINPLSSASN